MQPEIKRNTINTGLNKNKANMKATRLNKKNRLTAMKMSQEVPSSKVLNWLDDGSPPIEKELRL